MEVTAIRAKVKEIIAGVTNIAPQAIADDASFVDDLALDSLALLEIAVDVDYAFQLGLPEERLQGLKTVEEAVTLVRERLAAKDAEVA